MAQVNGKTGKIAKINRKAKHNKMVMKLDVSFHFIYIFDFSLTDLTLSLQDEELMLCNRGHHYLSTCHRVQVPASTPWISHTPQTEASQGRRQEDLPPPTIRLNSLLHSEGFSLTVLLLLQIHFL